MPTSEWIDMGDQWDDIFTALRTRHDLTRAQARFAFDEVMAGHVPEPRIGAMLGALMAKGECVDELVGAAQAMRAKCTRVRSHADCIDTCGTGGDGISTFNVSTTAAIIAAAAGATVAKHGNQSTTRRSGSTEVLQQLGIHVDADAAVVEQSLRDVRIGYLNARNLHPAMKFAAPARRAIPGRTIFNLLGPLTNPAGAQRQLLGVPSVGLTDKLAQALLHLGAVHAWVVHGADGLCDLTISGPTNVVEVHNGTLRRFSIRPEDVGFESADISELLVDSPAASARIVESVLNREPGPRRNHTLLNAGAALVVAGVASDLAEGVARAATAIDSGAAATTLRNWRAIAGAQRGGESS